METCELKIGNKRGEKKSETNNNGEKKVKVGRGGGGGEETKKKHEVRIATPTGKHTHKKT